MCFPSKRPKGDVHVPLSASHVRRGKGFYEGIVNHAVRQDSQGLGLY